MVFGMVHSFRLAAFLNIAHHLRVFSANDSSASNDDENSPSSKPIEPLAIFGVHSYVEGDTLFSDLHMLMVSDPRNPASSVEVVRVAQFESSDSCHRARFCFVLGNVMRILERVPTGLVIPKVPFS